MSRTRRHFTAKFKSDLVIELLKGEKDLNTLAADNKLQPNLLRNWKKEFLDRASIVFDDKREDNLKEKLASERREKAQYAKKVGLSIVLCKFFSQPCRIYASRPTCAHPFRVGCAHSTIRESSGCSILHTVPARAGRAA